MLREHAANRHSWHSFASPEISNVAGESCVTSMWGSQSQWLRCSRLSSDDSHEVWHLQGCFDRFCLYRIHQILWECFAKESPFLLLFLGCPCLTNQNLYLFAQVYPSFPFGVPDKKRDKPLSKYLTQDRVWCRTFQRFKLSFQSIPNYSKL